MVHQIRHAFVHAPTQATASKATGAKAPALATESHQMPFAARVAVRLCEAMLDNAAGQKLVCVPDLCEMFAFCMTSARLWDGLGIDKLKNIRTRLRTP